ncbi:MAG: Hsp20/alpha crystallin family protein [Inquilinus sp.]|nr:Hsp20/alpha crystallin family protein [Inquilinus sp.]
MAQKSHVPSTRFRPGFLTGNGELDPFRSLQREMERLFSDFGRGFAWPSLAVEAEGAVLPQLDVSESDDGLTVTAELPGMEEKDIEVDLTNNVLTLRGEKKTEREEKKADFHLRERSYGSFSRSIPVPFEVDAEQVKAAFAKGVLKVTLPRPPEAKRKTKKIAVKSTD